VSVLYKGSVRTAQTTLFNLITQNQSISVV